MHVVCFKFCLPCSKLESVLYCIGVKQDYDAIDSSRTLEALSVLLGIYTGIYNTKISECLGVNLKKLQRIRKKMDVLYFDLRPGQKCHSKWCTGRKWHILMVAGGNLLTKWDKLKFPWYSHRLMHRKRVTCELHDSYFRLMTIKHAIPKIELAIEWSLNYYITRSRQKVRQLEISCW